jgi:hypothetical protein
MMINPTSIRAALAATCAVSGLLASSAALAGQARVPGTLFITSSTYAGNAATLAVGTPLPITPAVDATFSGAYPTVFGNDTVDGNFGISSTIELTALPVSTTGVVSGPSTHINITHLTGVVTSFSSKSELSIHLSTDGSALTFTGYRASLNELDISNANTASVVDPTNTDIQANTPRSVVEFNLATGDATATDTNAYSGNNMRGAIKAVAVNGSSASEYLLVGNAGNGSGTPPASLVANTGVQVAAVNPGNVGAPENTTVVGAQQGTSGASKGFQYGFSVTSLGYPADKSGKDDNFRGSTVFGNTLYVTKGSGGNGIDTVYQVGTAGTLPTTANATTTPITVLPGFPTGLATNISDTVASTDFHPFGLFFANATTLYVADEGSQDLNGNVNAGLEKWVYNGSTWVLQYTIQAGLNLDQPYSVPGYPTAYNPAVTGLRHLTGFVNGNTVTFYATTATYSALGDPGADPNAVVTVTDQVNATTLPSTDVFKTVVAPLSRQVNRGVQYYGGTYPTPSP